MKKTATFLASAIPTFALANAAMGVALERYDPTAWIVYVIATILFEAWLMGTFIGFRWWKALLISVLANSFTAFCCAAVCGVGLHWGSGINPDPLAEMFLMFVGYGVISGGIESVVWFLFGQREISDPGNAIVKRTLLVHLAGVPLAMVIMLTPAHPYPFAEGGALGARLGALANGYNEAHVSLTAEKATIPTRSQLVDAAEGMLFPLRESDRWTLAYCPNFGRLCIGENRSMPFEWNTAALGRKVDLDPDHGKAIWILRAPSVSHFAPVGLVFDTASGRIRGSEDSTELGY